MSWMIALHLVGLLLVMPPSTTAQIVVGWSSIETPHVRFHFPSEARANPATITQADAAAALEELRAKAQDRMRRDRDVFTAQQLQEIESLYQPANRDLRAPASKEGLLQLLEKYPKANRSGCAVLYLAQLSSGNEREALLEKAIADHDDDWYGDGTQVGAFARAQLAAHYASTERLAEAMALAEQVGRLFPGAVDHSGNRLVDTLRRMKLLQ